MFVAEEEDGAQRAVSVVFTPNELSAHYVDDSISANCDLFSRAPDSI